MGIDRDEFRNRFPARSSSGSSSLPGLVGSSSIVSATIRGLPELKTILASIVPQLRRRALRNALAAGARVIRDDAKLRAPVLQPTIKAPYRTPGTVKKAIVVRTSKLARRRGDVGVFVNVRPAKAGARGAKSRTDPFYWRFLEFGTKFFKSGVGVQFLQGAAAKLPQALQVFTQALGPAVQKLNNRAARK
jgi:HK97 gp10 family phage protein